MVENLVHSTPAEKRADRFEKWLSVEGIKFGNLEAGQSYRARLTRIINAIKMKEPDRVPCFLPTGQFPAYYAGITVREAMYNYQEMKRAWLKFLHEFEGDTYSGPGVGSGWMNEILKVKSMKWPGHGLPANSTTHQFVEDEYMKADEYDMLINDPSDYCLRYYLPRTTGAFEPFEKLMPFRHVMGMPTSFLGRCMDPEIQSAFQAIIDSARELTKYRDAAIEVGQEALSLGYPSLMSGAQAHAPFDIFADTLRGTQGITMDMYRQPEKLLEAMEKITPWIIENALAAASLSKSPIVFFALHKGDDNFMSDRQFEKFYWPQFKNVIMGFVNEGLVPLLFAEGSFNRRLEIIKDLPPASVIWWFDRTDMARAKKVLGDVACIAGNVPTSLMCTGTPTAVKEYCRNLIETCGKGGGFILAGGASIDKGNPDNLRAMMAAAKEYGTYS
ncbi:MAG TPA: uroporphyrinogen decarboxylase family protein [Dehalococcoidales bacterium]